MAGKKRTRTPLNVSGQRVQSKLSECDFFLNHMRETEEPQAFAYHLSAFLAAFSSFVVLSLIRRNPRGYNAALGQLRESFDDIDRLLEFRDVEIHREGIRIWGFNQSPWTIPRFRRYGTRLETRFPTRYGSEVRRALEQIRPNPRAHAFLFETGGDVVELCTAGLDAARVALG